jgi:ketosteroid isomerase-like protein
MRFKKAAFSFLLLGFFSTSQAQAENLKQTILKLDSTFFHAYNTCDLATQASFYADSIEFFHDKSGLDTSKANILANTKKYICGKVRRELVPGSLEVSPLPGYGAVALGSHRFHNLAEGITTQPSKFVILWRQYNGMWKITKVISLH